MVLSQLGAGGVVHHVGNMEGHNFTRDLAVCNMGSSWIHVMTETEWDAWK